MKRHTSPGSCKTWFAWALPGLLLAASLPVSATAAERVVLCEEFTVHG